VKVRLLTLIAGPAGVFQPGAVVDVSEIMARELIAGRYAEAVEIGRVPLVETAALEPPEAAVLRQGRSPGRRAHG